MTITYLESMLAPLLFWETPMNVGAPMIGAPNYMHIKGPLWPPNTESEVAIARPASFRSGLIVPSPAHREFVEALVAEVPDSEVSRCPPVVAGQLR